VIPRLCYITDGTRGTAGRPLARVAARAVEGGLEMMVVRERTLAEGELATLLEALLPLRARGLSLLVSRRVDLAERYALDGVHLAADAGPVARARRRLGARAWIGYSAHAGDEARRAADEGASYVTLSPIYATESKPGAPARGTAWLAAAVKGLSIPALALGGVTPERVPELLAAGAWGVAAVSSLGAAADPATAARAFRDALARGGA
jgi:thiamine-phosphate diphosphorylase